MDKDTKIEKAAGKAGSGTAANFFDLKEDVQVILTPKEGAIGIAGKVQIVGTAPRKERRVVEFDPAIPAPARRPAARAGFVMGTQR